MTVHDFDACRDLGDAGERIVEAALGSRADWRIERKTPSRLEQSDLGIDYVGSFRRDRGTIQIKTDMRAAETKRIAFEQEHHYDNGDERDGWMRTMTATMLVVLVAERDGVQAVAAGESNVSPRSATILVFNVSALRAHEESWRASYQPRPAPNYGYQTLNLCIPMSSLRSSPALIADYMVTYSVTNGRLSAVATEKPKQGGLWGPYQ